MQCSMWRINCIFRLSKKKDISIQIAFEVVAPSIPGYGWSESPHKTGYSQIEAANTFQRLMTRLRFNKYYLQGGGGFVLL